MSKIGGIIWNHNYHLQLSYSGLQSKGTLQYHLMTIWKQLLTLLGNLRTHHIDAAYRDKTGEDVQAAGRTIREVDTEQVEGPLGS